MDKEFGDRVKAANVNATSDDSVAIVQQLGFNNHGLVIRSADGTAVWSQPDHEVNVNDVRGKLKPLLE